MSWFLVLVLTISLVFSLSWGFDLRKERDIYHDDAKRLFQHCDYLLNMVPPEKKPFLRSMAERTYGQQSVHDS